jgi:hypothetical protein
VATTRPGGALRHLPTHPLPDYFSLLAGVLYPALEVSDLLFELPPLIIDVIHLPLYKEALESHQNLLVHEETPIRRIQSEVEVVIVAAEDGMISDGADGSLVMILDGYLEFLPVLHLPLEAEHLGEAHALPHLPIVIEQTQGRSAREGQLELGGGLQAPSTHKLFTEVLGVVSIVVVVGGALEVCFGLSLGEGGVSV